MVGPEPAGGRCAEAHEEGKQGQRMGAGIGTTFAEIRIECNLNNVFTDRFFSVSDFFGT